MWDKNFLLVIYSKTLENVKDNKTMKISSLHIRFEPELFTWSPLKSTELIV